MIYFKNSHVMLAKIALFSVLALLSESFTVCSLHLNSFENSLKLSNSNYVQFQLLSPSLAITMEIFKMWLESDSRHRKW